ncbi:helix-turn-helix domain-containing protein [Bacteroides fragilis]|uniref:helix-turn-helix domain-containing protein n=1 Tax=Bacteroides fragilis TaxID=817 RepID=UPI001C70AEF9|nr:helix-turn-helix transcriptional regulator [Bacteroides fragilis]MBW9276671.1 helix-turn-helix transcriptional regulator [Bacteroides fragilis]
MSDSERIRRLEEYTGLSLNKLAAVIGIKSPQTFYDIKSGKHGISKDLAERIKAKYLNINISWLLGGEGEMTTPSVIQNNENGNNINGHSVKVEQKTDIEKLLDTIKECHELLRKKDEQIDRLLTLLEKK